MFHLFSIVLLIKLPLPNNEQNLYIKPGDDLVISLQYRSQLYLSMEEGLLVMNNDFFHPESIDYPIPISIRRIDYKYLKNSTNYYGILINGSPICSFGYLQNVSECDIQDGGDDKWMLKGSEDSFMIEGKGGCMTVFEPGEWSESFKHGVRIEACDKKANQKFNIKRGLL